MSRRHQPPKTPKYKVYSSYDPSATGRQVERRPEGRQKRIKESLPKDESARIPKWKIGGLLIVVLVVGYFSYINKVDVRTNLPESATTVEERAVEYLNAKPWRRLQFFLSTKELEQNIANETPEVKNVQIQRSLFSKRIIIETQARKSVAIWQQGRGGQKYVLDESGVAVKVLEEQSDLPLIISEQTFTEPKIVGKAVIDPNSLLGLGRWNIEVAELGLKIDYMLVSNLPRQATIYLKDTPYYILVSTSDVEEGAGGLKRTLETLSKDKQAPSSYIDVRIPYRVYYQ